MRPIVNPRHLDRMALLKRPWGGDRSGRVVGWWLRGLVLFIGGQPLDFAFGEIDRIEDDPASAAMPHAAGVAGLSPLLTGTNP